MLKRCAALWYEARLEVKMCKAHHFRSTFGNLAVEKVDTGAARNVQSNSLSYHFWKWRCWKIHALRLKALRGEAHVKVKMLKAPLSDHFCQFRCGFAWHAQGSCTLPIFETSAPALCGTTGKNNKSGKSRKSGESTRNTAWNRKGDGGKSRSGSMFPASLGCLAGAAARKKE